MQQRAQQNADARAPSGHGIAVTNFNAGTLPPAARKLSMQSALVEAIAANLHADYSISIPQKTADINIVKPATKKANSNCTPMSEAAGAAAAVVAMAHGLSRSEGMAVGRTAAIRVQQKACEPQTQTNHQASQKSARRVPSHILRANMFGLNTKKDRGRIRGSGSREWQRDKLKQEAKLKHAQKKQHGARLKNQNGLTETANAVAVVMAVTAAVAAALAATMAATASLAAAASQRTVAATPTLPQEHEKEENAKIEKRKQHATSVREQIEERMKTRYLDDYCWPFQWFEDKSSSNSSSNSRENWEDSTPPAPPSVAHLSAPAQKRRQEPSKSKSLPKSNTDAVLARWLPLPGLVNSDVSPLPTKSKPHTHTQGAKGNGKLPATTDKLIDKGNATIPTTAEMRASRRRVQFQSP